MHVGIFSCVDLEFQVLSAPNPLEKLENCKKLDKLSTKIYYYCWFYPSFPNNIINATIIPDTTTTDAAAAADDDDDDAQ